MTVKELIKALQKAKDKNAEVDIIDENGDEIALSENFLTVDEDDENVHIVLKAVNL